MTNGRLLSAALAILIAPSSHALSCAQPAPYPEVIGRSNLIFWGQVEKLDTVDKDNVHTVRVLRVVKGAKELKIKDSVKVRSSGFWGTRLNPSEKKYLFAIETGSVEAGFMLPLCSTGPYPESDEFSDANIQQWIHQYAGTKAK